MIKPLTGLIALALLSSILIAGCTGCTSNTHDSFLEKYVTTTRAYLEQNFTLQAWEVKWINNTAVNMRYTIATNKTRQVQAENFPPVKYNDTVLGFASTDDATAYINSLNRTEYVPHESVYHSGPYQTAAGHPPTTYSAYTKILRPTSGSYVIQLDNIVLIEESIEV
jgi:hypothetical protein